MRTGADQLGHGAPRLADLSAFPGVVGVAGVIDAETGIVGCKTLNIDHALLDDLGALGRGNRLCFFLFGHHATAFPRPGTACKSARYLARRSRTISQMR